MRFIPDYRVSYKGNFYECDDEIEIDPLDAEEMRKHGEVVEESTPSHKEPEEKDVLTADKPKRVRRRKSDDEPGEDETPNE